MAPDLLFDFAVTVDVYCESREPLAKDLGVSDERSLPFLP